MRVLRLCCDGAVGGGDSAWLVSPPVQLAMFE